MAGALFQSRIYGRQFGDDELSDVLSDRREVARLVLFERALARVQGRLGVIPAAAGDGIYAGLEHASIDLDSLAAGVCDTGVPVPALVAALRAQLPEDHGRWLHWGATSQDVVDTAHVLGLAEALDVLEERLGRLIDTLTAKSRGYADMVMAGRTRGQIATPITFGLRLAKWAQPLIHLENRLPQVREDALRVQFGGSAGANTAIAPHGPPVAAALAAELGLRPALPWHVDRTGIAAAADWLLHLSTALSKFAGDIILQVRSEVGEVRAGAGGGSSTMPQKANPVGPETIRSLATIARTAHAGLAAAGDHAEERDGAAWPVEWALLPQLIIASGAALRHAATVAEYLEPRSDRMGHTIGRYSGIMAEQASFILAARLPRAEAQRLVKRATQTERPLAEALADVCDLDLDWHTLLDPTSIVAPCRDLAEEILSTRARGD